MWFYQKANAQHGPVTEAQVDALIGSREITRQTLVWTEGMANWAPILETPLAARFPKDQPPPMEPPPPPQATAQPPATRGPSMTPKPDDIKLLDTQFMAFWICLAAGIPLSLFVVGIFGVIAGVVFFYLMLYRFWDLIQDGEARTTPGKAVGFSFIPFFNLYWIFIAIWGLAKDMNAYVKERDIKAIPINEDLVLAYCILICTGFIPYIGLVTVLAAIVILVFAVKQMKESAQAIIGFKLAS